MPAATVVLIDQDTASLITENTGAAMTLDDEQLASMILDNRP